MSRNINRYEHSDLGGDIGEFIADVLTTIVLLFLFAVALEIYRLHKENPPFGEGESAQEMRLVGLMFLCSVGLSILLALFPSTQTIAPYPVSIGFFAWVVALYYINIKHEQPVSPDDPSLEDTLQPWKFKAPAREEEKKKEPVAANNFK